MVSPQDLRGVSSLVDAAAELGATVTVLRKVVIPDVTRTAEWELSPSRRRCRARASRPRPDVEGLQASLKDDCGLRRFSLFPELSTEQQCEPSAFAIVTKRRTEPSSVISPYRTAAGCTCFTRATFVRTDSLIRAFDYQMSAGHR